MHRDQPAAVPGPLVALVTGGARRIGAQIVRTLHHHGMKVAVHYHRSARDAHALVSELNRRRPGSALALTADLLDPEAPARLIGQVCAEFGRLDVLVNNASSFFPTPIDQSDEASWNNLLGTNLKAPFFLSCAAAPHLRRSGGSIVNLGDIHGARPLAGHSIYCAAKAGLLMLTQALALELGPRIRVNAVSPGPILWPQGPGAVTDHATRDAIVQSTLLKRAGTPVDVADTVLFLLTQGRYITGQNIAVDGGRSIAS